MRRTGNMPNGWTFRFFCLYFFVSDLVLCFICATHIEVNVFFFVLHALRIMSNNISKLSTNLRFYYDYYHFPEFCIGLFNVHLTFNFPKVERISSVWHFSCCFFLFFVEEIKYVRMKDKKKKDLGRLRCNLHPTVFCVDLHNLVHFFFSRELTIFECALRPTMISLIKAIIWIACVRTNVAEIVKKNECCIVHRVFFFFFVSWSPA